MTNNPTPPDQPPASRQGADELDAILVLFSKRLAIVQGEYNASTKLSEVQKHAEEAQDEAKAAIAALIETEVLNAKIDLISWCFSRTSMDELKNRWRELEQELAELEAGSGEAV